MFSDMVIKYTPNKKALTKEQNNKCPVCGSSDVIEEFGIDNTRYNQCVNCYCCYVDKNKKGVN